MQSERERSVTNELGMIIADGISRTPLGEALDGGIRESLDSIAEPYAAAEDFVEAAVSRTPLNPMTLLGVPLSILVTALLIPTALATTVLHLRYAV